MGDRLASKVAIIAGSTAGIGRASAELFAREGAKVVVSGRRANRGEEVVKAIRDAGGQAIFVQADVGSEEDIRHLVDEAVAAYGTVDVLMNSAGGARRGLIHELSSEDFTFTVNMNIRSCFLAMKYVLPIMMEKRGGSIINVSSASVHIAMPTASLYQMTKAGLDTLTRVAAREYAAYGIRCNVLAPGCTDTELLSIKGEAKEKMIQSLAMKRMGRPEEIANGALFLASGESSYCSGRSLEINGADYL